MKTSWINKPVTILGLSKSGVASALYLAKRGARCFLSETMPANPTNRENIELLTTAGVEIETGGHSSRCFEHSDLVVVSPGIPPSSQILKELLLSGKTIISEIELAYRETDIPFIGITGTNGKTTTTTLISKILEAGGYNAPACGNIGIPVISLLEEKIDFFVVELSSFQLAFSPTLKTKAAVFTNFRPDHLDWHGSIEAYKKAKFLLFSEPHTPEWAVLNADDSVCNEIAEFTKANICWFSRKAENVSNFKHHITIEPEGDVVIKAMDRGSATILNISDLKIVGNHNRDNVLAAAATCWLLGVEESAIRKAISEFEGVEHRLEKVSIINGITYYNDSKATNPDAALSALQAFESQKVVLIAGGRDKKTDLKEFADAVKQYVHHVVLIGEAADRFALEFKAAGYTSITYANSLEDAVIKASDKASNNIPVLFSPACASFDMFKNFEERGRAFKNAVQGILTVSNC